MLSGLSCSIDSPGIFGWVWKFIFVSPSVALDDVISDVDSDVTLDVALDVVFDVALDFALDFARDTVRAPSVDSSGSLPRSEPELDPIDSSSLVTAPSDGCGAPVATKQHIVGSSDVTFAVNAAYFLMPGLVVITAMFLCLSSRIVLTNFPRPQISVVATAFIVQLGHSPWWYDVQLPFSASCAQC
jgi:hypothetical protein